MTLRTRIGLACGAVVFLTLVAFSAALYPALSSRLHDQLDASLVDTAGHAPDVLAEFKKKGEAFFPAPLDLGSTLLQLVNDQTTADEWQLAPLSGRDQRVAQGDLAPYFQQVVYRRQSYRVYTAPLAGSPGQLIRIARPLSDATSTLNRLAVLLVALTIAGTAVATVAARLLAGRILAPVRRLTETAEHITTTHDLSARLGATTDNATGDEVGRLAGSFDSMLRSLEDSVQAQRRLVADASHELRTPLTSLTTNLELLSEGKGTADPQAPDLVREARVQAGELHRLVDDLVDLARYGQAETHTEDTRLDLLVGHVIERAAVRAPQLAFDTDLQECLVHVDPDAVERAVGNLVDNAVKWSSPGATIRVSVRDGEVAVADQGPGIPAADLPYVFDRFYRSPQARSLPGSGLGLAIVQQVAQAHGGHVTAEPQPRGVLLRLALPLATA